MKVAVFSSKPYDKTHLENANQGQHEFTFFEPHLDEQTAALSAGFDAVCCFVNDTLSAEVIDTLANNQVQLIALRCAGFNNVDLAQAEKRGLTVARVPEYSPYAVAEHAVALAMSLNRNLHRAHNRVRENDYSLHGLLGFDMHGKTVGVIGTGKIGIAFIRIMVGFGCRVICSDPYPNPEAEHAGAQYVSLDTLWSDSDIISLHCPLVPATRHLINQDSLSQMKPGVMLLNTSRGALIDTQAVIDALKTGQIGYLGLDVYEEEADLFFEDNSNEILRDDTFARLLTFKNVMITGHQAFFTNEALSAIARVTIENLSGFAEGKPERICLVSTS
ncbi:2-hydroxyacid dehydrogenase [Reinekea blandensis]|uniref:D-lactate dehydrogenase n=1 Tax=Reinekea blandensis MED297 TaxID=314283 RepID=A4BFG5_9GAMM|nr:2-hydroxyacid dehydrogenase [Reinekea blandensis]EAR09060.1 D-lactate dehydrogenase [Reinekea sp. MED297] [Reinekea blandensis MED297]